MDADELQTLADSILGAWKKGDVMTLKDLIRGIPDGYAVCVVNPHFHDPTIIVGSIKDVQALTQQYDVPKVAGRFFTARRELEQDTPINGHIVPETDGRKERNS